jgi:hypothetical protein
MRCALEAMVARGKPQPDPRVTQEFGLGPAETLATNPAKDINPQWGDPRPFPTMAFKSLWGHLAPDA